jgi:hypothetical protein
MICCFRLCSDYVNVLTHRPRHKVNTVIDLKSKIDIAQRRKTYFTAADDIHCNVGNIMLITKTRPSIADMSFQRFFHYWCK